MKEKNKTGNVKAIKKLKSSCTRLTFTSLIKRLLLI